MTDKIEISKRNVKVSQTITWAMTVISMLFISVYLFFDFTKNGAIIWLIWLIFNCLMQYWSTKIWNIWYEDEKLYFQNIYKTIVRDIKLFKTVEMASSITPNYKLYLSNNESYNFGLSRTDDLKLLFKWNSQLYAKDITQKLNKLKNT